MDKTNAKQARADLITLMERVAPLEARLKAATAKTPAIQNTRDAIKNLLYNGLPTLRAAIECLAAADREMEALENMLRKADNGQADPAADTGKKPEKKTEVTVETAILPAGGRCKAGNDIGHSVMIGAKRTGRIAYKYHA